MAAESLYRSIREAVIAGDKAKAGELASEAVSLKLDLNEVINKGFIPGIQTVGELWAMGEYFLPELITSAECMKSSMDIIQAEMVRSRIPFKSAGRVVIGTVEGDIHDIGKNLVAAMLQANGFEVFDLGANVKMTKFIEKAEAEGADLICLSALLTTTMLQQRKFLETLREKGLRMKFKVMVGGAPATRKWAEDIGADGYAENAASAVKAARALMGGA